MEISCTLRTSYRAVLDASRATERLGSSVSGEVHRTVQAVTLELVEAAVRRARAANQKALTFWVRLSEDRVRMEIADHGSLFPSKLRRKAGSVPESYARVGRVADSWGVVTFPNDRSVVWAEVGIGLGDGVVHEA